MSKVIAIMSMSLDGYVTDLNDGVAEVFDWYFNSGDVGGRGGRRYALALPSTQDIVSVTAILDGGNDEYSRSDDEGRTPKDDRGDH